MSTIFKKIIDRAVPADIVYEDEHCLSFKDIQPSAPVHLLVIPKKEIATLDDASAEDQRLLGHLLLTIPKIAKQAGLEKGYKVQMNVHEGGGQEVFHLHFHVLGRPQPD
jgi:histidine triad (HIT) family protein